MKKGKKYLKIIMCEKKYNIIKLLQEEKHFPKIFKEKKIGNRHHFYMPFYVSKKFIYKERRSFMENYIKSLLLTIKNYMKKDIYMEI